MGQGIGFSVEKPVGVWNKDLDVDFKAFFKGLTKYAIHGLSGQWASAGEDLVDITSAVGLQTKPAELAWLLIRRSLAKAMAKLTVDTLKVHGKEPRDSDALVETLDLTLEQTPISIEPWFFERPGDLAITQAIKQPFAQWLEGFELNPQQAKAVANRVPSYLTMEMHKEWAARPNDYASIQQALDSPFLRATERQLGWRRNAAFLQRLVDEPVFGETFSLRQIYVPLRAYFTRKQRTAHLKELVPDFEGGMQRPERVVVRLKEHLRSWLESQNRSDAIRVICGGPGCGKSTFAKMFAAELAATTDIPILFIPLHQFDFRGDIVRAVGDYVRDSGIVRDNPLASEGGEHRIIIFFDGLDELAMQGRVGQEAASEFVDQLDRTVDRLNLSALRLNVIVGGRQLVVEANARIFRQPGQILHILPYVLDESPVSGSDSKDEVDPLSEDQRDVWWRQYGEVTGRGYTALPPPLRISELREVTGQPLLNYLLALSYDRGRVDFSKEHNLNMVYDDLLDAVYDRRWGPTGHPATRELRYSEFVGILEDIGLAAWHSDGRKTTVSAIGGICERSGLKSKLAAFEKGAEAGATSLLAAFYFREIESSGGDRTFEFTHKSFGEYLTSRRLVRGIDQIERSLQAGRQDYALGWNETRALVEWVKLAGPTPMNRDLFAFVRREVALRAVERVGIWQRTLAHLLSVGLRQGLPMEHSELILKTFKDMYSHGRNSEESLLGLHYACASIIRNVSSIDWLSPTSFKEFLGRHEGSFDAITKRCLAYLDCAGQELSFVNLMHGNLEGSNLQGAQLSGTNMRMADLRGSNLSEAYLFDANLMGANLVNSDLSHAKLNGADLRGADLAGADLTDVELGEVAYPMMVEGGGQYIGINTRLGGAKIDPHWFEELRIDPGELALEEEVALEASRSRGRRAGNERRGPSAKGRRSN